MKVGRLAAAGIALFAASTTIPAQQTMRQPDYCAMPATTRPSLPATLMDGMGKAHFAMTTALPKAQEYFNQGLAQLQGFWFVEAERSFMQAAAIDPSAPMTYWGIAMSAAGDALPAFQLAKRTNQGQASPPAGSPEARARDASRKALGLRGRATAQEKLYIDAVAARRNPNAKEPDADYVAVMRKLVKEYPGDLLAKSLLALALENGYHPVTRQPGPGTLEAISLLQQVLSKDPDHIGANHYLVHAYEGGREPRTALRAATRLPSLAPKIPHIVHMPGHIYVPTGRYDEAIAAFEATAALERDYIQRDALNPTAHYSHNQHFLVHARGVDGRFEESLRGAKEMLEFRENPRERASVNGVSVYRDGWFVLMKTLVRFEKWELILDGTTLPVYDKPRERAWYHYARGLAYGGMSQTDKARQEYVEMRRSMDELQKVAGWVPAALGVAMNELEGFARIKGNDDLERGLNLMRRAIQLEDSMPYTEPPAYPRPVREIFGRAMLERKDYRAAEAIYRELLQKEPGSGRAFWGLTQALEGAGRMAEAQLTRREFVKAWANADATLPEKK